MLGFGAGRALAYLVAGWLGLLCVASISSMMPAPRLWFPFLAPNLALLVVLFVGLSGRATFAGVVVIACALGYLGDLVSGAPKGVHMSAFALVAMAVRASQRVLVRGALATAIVAGTFTGLCGLLVIGLRAAVGLGVGFGLLRRVPYEALSTALVAPLAFRGLGRLERLLSREVRALPAR